MSSALGLERALRRCAAVPSQIAGEVADAFNDRIQDGFDQGADPYGIPFAPLAPATLAKGRTPPPLTETGTMRGGTYAGPLGGAGVGLYASDVDYAARHMTGEPSQNLPARAYLPNRGLPTTWLADIRRIYLERFGRAWRG